MIQFSLDNILAAIGGGYSVAGSGTGLVIANVKTPKEADESSLVWIDPTRSDKDKLASETRARVIVCDDSLVLTGEDADQKVIIQVRTPKLAFINVVNALFCEPPVYSIHPSAIIHPDAKIAPHVFIGPFCCVGRSEIGEGTIIYGNVHIYDKVRIGRNVVIEAGSVIGATGYNFVRDEDGVYHKFPHLGGVIIEDDVEIQALSVVDRGVLGDTVVGKGTKIDSCCYIAHNCNVGRHNAIVGQTMLSGSVRVGDHCWIGPSTIVRDQVSIGSNSLTGMGSIVVSNLEKGSKVMGNPARPIELARAMQKKLKSLVQHD